MERPPISAIVSQGHGRNAANLTAVPTKLTGNSVPRVPGRKHVMLGIPCLKAQLTTSIATLMCDCVMESLKPGGRFVYSFHIINDYFPTEYARNVICRHFLEGNADYLWFIDSDTMPDANSFKLFDVDADIVAGVYPIGRQERGNRVLALDWGLYNQAPEHEFGWVALPLEAYQKGEVIDVDAAATGCMLIKRHVIEYFAKAAARDEDNTPAVFAWPKKPSGKSVCSDDFDFCKRAKAAGFGLKVHTAVRWGHLKFKDMRDVYEQLKSAWQAGYEESMEDGGYNALKEGMQLDASSSDLSAVGAI